MYLINPQLDFESINFVCNTIYMRLSINLAWNYAYCMSIKYQQIWCSLNSPQWKLLKITHSNSITNICNINNSVILDSSVFLCKNC